MNTITSRNGKEVDMVSLASKNENTVAIGNANMNTRGDIVEKSGKVIKPREEVVQDYYANNPKSVTSSVSLNDIGDQVMTPQQVMAEMKAKQSEEKKTKQSSKKTSTKSTRKVVIPDDED